MQPFMRRPFGCRNLLSRNFTFQPALGLLFHSSECRRGRPGSRRWKSWLVDPFVHRNSRGQRGLFIQQILFQVSNELIGRDALKSEVIEIALEKDIKTRAPKGLLELTQKERAFFIRNVG